MKKKYKIEGMTCSACQSHVQRSVEKLEGMNLCNVNLLANSMDVEFDETKLSNETIIQAVEKAGYKAIDSVKKETTTTTEKTKKDYNGRTLLLASIFALLVFYLAMGPMLYIPIPSFFESNPLIDRKSVV